jgi:PHD/YefM family antitoxin component YafN of YafNO toxin-antitoxin module
MLDIKRDITSLSNFQRNTRDFLLRLKETAHPLVLTVNGNAELVVQDAASYQKLLDRATGKQVVE